MSAEGQDKIRQMVTDQIIAALEAGTVPWRKPWQGGASMPLSMSTNKPYRGVNVWLLGFKASAKGYSSPYWGTYKHITELGGQVRTDEKSTMIVFWKRLIVKDDKAPDGKKAIFMLRYYRVFNACQADGLPEKYYPEPPKPFTGDVNDAAEQIIAGYLTDGGPKLRKAFRDGADYEALTDTVTLPEDGQFLTGAGRYYTTFHELTHSTGHKDRLNREGVANFDHHGSGRYAKEELVAEMGSAMLLATVGISTETENNAAYIASWLKALRNDSSLVISASAQAQRAVDLISGVEFKSEEG